MKLNHLLTADMIVPELSGQTREEILQEMVDWLKHEKNINRKGKELLEKLIQRENLGSTAIGEGVAVPHCKVKGLDQPIVLLGISRKGVEFQAVDQKPVYLFFLVISPPENPSMNLQILAAIAHLVRESKGLVKKILQAKSNQEILRVIREEEEKAQEE